MVSNPAYPPSDQSPKQVSLVYILLHSSNQTTAKGPVIIFPYLSKHLVIFRSKGTPGEILNCTVQFTGERGRQPSMSEERAD